MNITKNIGSDFLLRFNYLDENGEELTLTMLNSCEVILYDRNNNEVVKYEKSGTLPVQEDVESMFVTVELDKIGVYKAFLKIGIEDERFEDGFYNDVWHIANITMV